MITAKTPWAEHLGAVPLHLDYFEGSMFDKVVWIAEQYPEQIAFDFLGSSVTYRQMIQEIRRCCASLRS